MSRDDNYTNIEITLKHFVDQLEKYNSAINTRLDKISDLIDDLRSHKTLVIQLEKRVDMMEERYMSMSEKIQKLDYDNVRRQEITKSITNPLIQKVLWVVIGAVLMMFGVSWNKIDTTFSVKNETFMKDQLH